MLYTQRRELLNSIFPSVITDLIEGHMLSEIEDDTRKLKEIINLRIIMRDLDKIRFRLNKKVGKFRTELTIDEELEFYRNN